MIENRTYTHRDGRIVSVAKQFNPMEAIGAIYSAVVSFGPMSMSVLVTEAGLQEGGFVLVEAEPDPDPEPT